MAEGRQGGMYLTSVYRKGGTFGYLLGPSEPLLLLEPSGALLLLWPTGALLGPSGALLLLGPSGALLECVGHV